MTRIGLHHVSAQALPDHLQTTQHLPHRAGKSIFVSRVGTLKRLEHAPFVVFLRREIKREARVRSLESAMDVAVWNRLVPRLIAVDIRLCQVFFLGRKRGTLTD